MFNCISQHRENIDPKRCQPDDADAVAAFPDFRRRKESKFRSMLRKGRNTLHRLCIHGTILVKNFVQIHQFKQFQQISFTGHFMQKKESLPIRVKLVEVSSKYNHRNDETFTILSQWRSSSHFMYKYFSYSRRAHYIFIFYGEVVTVAIIIQNETSA